MIRIYPVCLLMVVLCTACQGQSFEQAMEIICDPKEHLTDVPEDPDVRPFALIEVIYDKVTNEEALFMMQSLSGAPRDEQRRHLEEAAARSGLDSCPFLD